LLGTQGLSARLNRYAGAFSLGLVARREKSEFFAIQKVEPMRNQ